MAEVMDFWPNTRKPPAQQFHYPWDQWMALDENGHGDIWLATLGIDWAPGSNVANFKNTLYTRAVSVNKRRQKKAPMRVMRVKGTDKVKRVPYFRALRVKTCIVSETQVAFQFYDSPEPPPPPPVTNKVAVPRRHNLHGRVVTTAVQRVKVPA